MPHLGFQLLLLLMYLFTSTSLVVMLTCFMIRKVSEPHPVVAEQLTENLAFTFLWTKFSFNVDIKLILTSPHFTSPLIAQSIWMSHKLVLKAPFKASHHFAGNHPFKSDS